MSGHRTIGIDLGTTNSVVATIDDDGAPRILTNSNGDTTTPSMIAFERTADGLTRRYIGAPAKGKSMVNPRCAIFGAKRLIGRRYDDPEVQQLAAILPYEIVAAPNGDAWVSVNGLHLSPQEISAILLYEMRMTAERFFGGPVSEAIITVPAYFDNQQRQATKDAAELAGLKVRRLLNEPTAAALGYGAHRGADRRFAVCDLGGGTFDVSIVNVEHGVFEVISTHGDTFLGGDDFDRAIIEELIGEIQSGHGLDVRGNIEIMQRVKHAAQDAKHALSAEESTSIRLPYLGASASGPVTYERTLTRGELETWTLPILERLDAPCREAVARCSLAPRDIDAVILVGGMTRMPAVQRRIASIFGRQPLEVENPDEIVSVGAATQCAILDGTIGGVVLLDVTSRALGISVGEGRYQRVIPRNVTIPTREHKILATTEDNQTELAFDIWEGESVDLSRNRHVGRYVCCGLPPAPAGEVLLLIDLTVDVDGILRVSASELSSGERPVLRLVATAGLTRADVKRLSQVMAENR